MTPFAQEPDTPTDIHRKARIPEQVQYLNTLHAGNRHRASLINQDRTDGMCSSLPAKPCQQGNS